MAVIPDWLCQTPTPPSGRFEVDENGKHELCIWPLHGDSLLDLADKIDELDDDDLDPEFTFLVVTEDSSGDGVVLLDAGDGLSEVNYAHHGYVRA